MVTPENSRRNLKTAADRVAARLGVDRAALTYEQRGAYNKALAAEILAYPASFTPETLASARIVAGRTYQELKDTSFDLGEFTDAAAESGRQTLAAVGNNLLTAAVIVAAVYVAVKAWRSTPIPASA